MLTPKTVLFTLTSNFFPQLCMSESLDPRKTELKELAKTQLESLQNADSAESRATIILHLQQTRKQMSDLLISLYGSEENAINDTDLDDTFTEISDAIDPKRYRPGSRAFSKVEPRKEGEEKNHYAARNS